jgi:hypothetical protein
MRTHTFTVRKDEDSPEHDVSVKVVTYAEATEAQRKNLFEEGMSSVTIKVQGTCRRRLAKGIRGEALNAEAQKAFDAVINGTKAAASVVVMDATANKFNAAQIAALEASGVVVINKPKAEDKK